jgi:cellulose 1,4-beta-cellobiosidase
VLAGYIKVLFRYPFNEFGCMASMGKGMVLVMSLWDDHYVNMLWLDSMYPTDRDPESPGSGVSAEVPGAQVVFSDIKFGPIGSIFKQPA